MDMTQEFKETAARLFGDLATPAVLEAAEAGQFPQALWDAINESGFGLTLVPEEQGGIGAGLQEAAAILLAAGEHAVPGPLLETMLGNQLLALASREPSTEPLALAFVEDATKPLRNVPWVRSASQVLVVAQDGAGARLAVFSAQALESHAEIPDAAGEPTARLVLPANLEWQHLAGTGFDGLLQRASLLRGAQMAGAMRWCLERTTAYTQERKQFGRDIGKFQVVQQMVAELAAAVVASHALLDAALAVPDNAAFAAAARSRLADASDTVFGLSHQVHGAIGFSYEYVLHFRTRRLMAWRDQFGTVAYWRRQLAQGFAGKSADEVWPAIAG